MLDLSPIRSAISLAPPDIREAAITALAQIEDMFDIADNDRLMMLSAPRSPHWPAVRAQHLEKFPSCAACGTTKDLDAHHKQPFHEHPELELELGNLITLCSWRNCHLRFGHSFLWSAWNPHVAEDAARQLSRIKTRMV